MEMSFFRNLIIKMSLPELIAGVKEIENNRQKNLILKKKFNNKDTVLIKK